MEGITSGELYYAQGGGQAALSDCSEEFRSFLAADHDLDKRAKEVSDDLVLIDQIRELKDKQHDLRLRTEVTTMTTLLDAYHLSYTKMLDSETEKFNIELEGLKRSSDTFMMQQSLQYYNILKEELLQTRNNLIAQSAICDLQTKQAHVNHDLKVFAHYLQYETRDKVLLSFLDSESSQFRRCRKAIRDNLGSFLYNRGYNDAKILSVIKIEHKLISSQLQRAAATIDEGKVKGLFCVVPKDGLHALAAFGLHAQRPIQQSSKSSKSSFDANVKGSMAYKHIEGGLPKLFQMSWIFAGTLDEDGKDNGEDIDSEDEKDEEDDEEEDHMKAGEKGDSRDELEGEDAEDEYEDDFEDSKAEEDNDGTSTQAKKGILPASASAHTSSFLSQSPKRSKSKSLRNKDDKEGKGNVLNESKRHYAETLCRSGVTQMMSIKARNDRNYETLPSSEAKPLSADTLDSIGCSFLKFSRSSTPSAISSLSAEELESGFFVSLCRVLISRQKTINEAITDKEVKDAEKNGYDCVYSNKTEEYVLIKPQYVLPEFLMFVEMVATDIDSTVISAQIQSQIEKCSSSIWLPRALEAPHMDKGHDRRQSGDHSILVGNLRRNTRSAKINLDTNVFTPCLAEILYDQEVTSLINDGLIVNTSSDAVNHHHRSDNNPRTPKKAFDTNPLSNLQTTVDTSILSPDLTKINENSNSAGGRNRKKMPVSLKGEAGDMPTDDMEDDESEHLQNRNGTISAADAKAYSIRKQAIVNSIEQCTQDVSYRLKDLHALSIKRIRDIAAAEGDDGNDYPVPIEQDEDQLEEE
jgi:hypothetical protein